MQDPQKLIQRFKSRVHVLDGGLATELEKRGHDISGKLWSAQVLLDDPGAIEQLHYDYLKAGADIIITSSYQLTFQGMKEAGYTHEQAEEALWKSVEVAVKARERYLSELDEDPPEDRKPLIAASIGPYGAYLADGSEYRGYEGPDGGEMQLFEFHRERFEYLAACPVDLLSIETLPAWTNEGEAFERLLRELPHTAAWISFTWQDSHHTCAGNELDWVHFRTSQSKNFVAFGLNCSSPTVVSDLLQNTRQLSTTQAERIEKPIVVYPNSGEGWDAEHRCWVGENDAEHFAAYAREWIKAGANIIGGCCRTGPEHIAQLRKLVDSMEGAS